MNNLICIIAGEPNSVNSELIAKVWKKRKNLKKINVVVIGNYLLSFTIKTTMHRYIVVNMQDLILGSKDLVMRV